MSRQILFSHHSIRQSINSKEEFVEDYSALKEDLKEANSSISSIKTDFTPLFGAQLPEGNITSNNSMVYYDTTNSPIDVSMYFNDTVGAKTGWVKVV